ncbi:MAG: extracellular solute-binding protein [Aestuariivita sp.]|uniref:ABC transporter substrate-binding protein n=1 Tax=Aestuariivita sp. TaxID=1872407 RepID=UPI003BAF7E0E
MDVLDQLGAVREGKMSRRAFNSSLFAAGVSTVMMPVLPRKAMAAPEDHATWFTWGGFDIPDYFDEYVAMHGELPNFATYGSTEEAFNKLRSGFVADLVLPCLSDVPRWSSSGLFQPIDTSRLSNWSDQITELGDVEYNKADGGLWMVPWEWGQTSIAYRTDLFDLEGEESWDMLWDERYAGRLGMLGGGGDVWWCAAIKAGVPFEEIHTDEAFEKISAVLRAQRPLIRTYTDDTTSLDTALAAGELIATLAWNSTAVNLSAAGVPVRFAQPKEGALTWVCGLMLHAQAPKIDSAYDVINSMLSEAATVALMRGSGYGGPNRKALDQFSDEELAALGLTRNPQELLQAGHFGIPQTAEWDQRMTSTWEQIKLGF